MKRIALAAMLLLAACADAPDAAKPTGGQVAAPNGQAGAPDGRADPEAGQATPPGPLPFRGGTLSLPGMTLDLDARRITIQAQVGLRAGLLELLVCRERSGRAHESILRTSAVPSEVHAALLALGLSPGVPARWMALPEGEWQAIPPRGARLMIRLRWTDENGEIHERPAGEWLELIAQASTPPDAREWVFVGSELMPNGGYWADATGEVITVSNFPSTLIDVPFDSSPSTSQLLYRANTDAIPPLGTMVEVIITPLPGAEKADYARVSITIDRNGDIHADGQTLPIDDVDDWAMDFIAAHRNGQVVVRTDPLALSHRVRQVRQELRIGGVYEIHELRMDLTEQLLPRTPQQMQTALDELTYALGHVEEFIEDPFQGADLLLMQIQGDRQELQRLDELWRQYAESVQEAVDQHRRLGPPQEIDDFPRE